MILVFGGTTEGRIVAETLDFIREKYWYSTKTTTNVSVGGLMLQGAMEESEIVAFCKANDIRLIVDAAHPFAENLHANIHAAACESELPILRFERKMINPRLPNVRYFSSYKALTTALEESNFRHLLFLTGVQTIPHFQNIWKERDAFFRILDTELSRRKANSYGIPEERIFSIHPDNSSETVIELAKKVKADILVSKESGAFGFFESKIEAANALNIPLWVVNRPELPESTFTVYSQKELLQQLYIFRKDVLRKGKDLRSGYTTGTCVLAATKANFLALVNGKFPKEVEVEIPMGDKVRFLVFPEELNTQKASCVVIKNAGDDPDVTHAKEIGCTLQTNTSGEINFLQGKGIGKVTLSGLQVAVGDPAINAVPRKTISDLLLQMALEYELDCGFNITPFVPEGEELAKQTFNPRVGVVGGISIIGTTGVVRPFSNAAFLSSIRQQIMVVCENGCNEIVLTSGKRSENRVKDRFPHLSSVAFIHFGNMIGETLKVAVAEGIQKISLAIMFGKGIKLAEGHLDTHSKNVQFNPAFAAGIAEECGYPKNTISVITELKLANAIVDIIPFAEDVLFYQRVSEMCRENCLKLLPEKCSFELFLLVGNDGILKSGDY